ncbi:MAG: PKD domain-containing protein [Bacteroidales bacterium]|nr:PKD domain-containing protein [Bacteroidales bacterium]
MKKFLLSIVAIFAMSICGFAQISVCDNPCPPATDGFSTGVVPYSPTTFPTMYVGQYVEQCITIQCPASALGATVDSIWFKNFIGAPDGLSFCISDTMIDALEYCTVNFSGTPTTAGEYGLKMRAHLYGNFMASIANAMVDTENGYSTGITLTVHEQGSVIASFTTDPEVTSSWTSSSVNITAGETVSFTSTCNENTHHVAWNFPGGNPETSSADEVTVTYMTAGNFVATLVAYNENETSTDTATVNISVSAAPVIITVDFEADNTTVYTGQAVNFTNNTTATQAGNDYTGELYYRWTFDADNGSLLSGSTSSEENPSYTYTTAGVYSVKLAVATSQYGVYTTADTLVKHAYITVEEDPYAVIADFTSDPAASGMLTQSISVEQGASVTYTSTSTGATSLAWTFEGGSPESSTNEEVTVTYNTAGSFTTTLVAYGEGDRQNTKSITVNVGEPTPVFSVDFVADYTTINVGETVNFTNNTTATLAGEPYTGDVYFQWNFNAGNILGGLTGSTSTDINASYTYTTAGVYSVSLAASTSEISLLNQGTVETKDSYITVTDPVAVDENAISEISVYPNPTSSVINIAAEGMQNITIIDMTGRVVMCKDVNSNFETIDAEGFAKANYMVRIATADGVVVKNVIVE